VVFVKGDTTIKESVNTYRLINSVRQYYYQPIGLLGETAKYPSGVYDSISIRAVGGTSSVNSSYKPITEYGNDTTQTIYKLQTPAEVQSVLNGEVLYLKWRAVSYQHHTGSVTIATSYRLKLVNNVTGSVVGYQIVSYGDDEVSIDTDALVGTTIFSCNLSELLLNGNLEGFVLTQGSYNIYIQSLPLPIDQSGTFYWDTLNSDYSNAVAITKPGNPTSVVFSSTLKAYTWIAPTVGEGISVTYDVLVFYKSSVGQVWLTNVENNVYYPSKLGIYKIAVSAKVSGSLSSDYVGVSNLIPKFMVQQGQSSVQMEISSVDWEGGSVIINDLLNGVSGVHDLFGGGEGTQTNPYQINTAEQFYRMNYYYKSQFYFIQKSIINMSVRSVPGDTTLITVGSLTTPFAGNYDGNNVNGLYITNQTYSSTNVYLGLFAYVNGANIINLTIKNSSININKRDTAYAGLIVGYGVDVIMENCITYGSINITYAESYASTYYVGGLVGYTRGTRTFINNCLNYANIGKPIAGTLSISYAGGIAGWIDNTADDNGVMNSGNLGAIQGTVVGGSVGNALCPITNCFNIGNITSNYASNKDSIAGGIAGQNLNTSTYSMFGNCYNVGNISTLSSTAKQCYTGGCVGYGNTFIFNFYNAGILSATKLGIGATQDNVGWLAGGSASGGTATKIEVVNGYTTTNDEAVGTGSYDGNVTYTTMVALGANVATWLGIEFEYISANGRVTLKIESIVFGLY